jgi:hypothetical protein
VTVKSVTECVTGVATNPNLPQEQSAQRARFEVDLVAKGTKKPAITRAYVSPPFELIHQKKWWYGCTRITAVKPLSYAIVDIRQTLPTDKVTVRGIVLPDLCVLHIVVVGLTRLLQTLRSYGWTLVVSPCLEPFGVDFMATRTDVTEKLESDEINQLHSAIRRSSDPQARIEFERTIVRRFSAPWMRRHRLPQVRW